MHELGIALGLMLVIEGMLYALFPQQMVEMLRRLHEVPPQVLRSAGLVAVAIGWLIVWWIKH